MRMRSETERTPLRSWAGRPYQPRCPAEGVHERPMLKQRRLERLARKAQDKQLQADDYPNVRKSR